MDSPSFFNFIVFFLNQRSELVRIANSALLYEVVSRTRYLQCKVLDTFLGSRKDLAYV
jgi:hypothetical protein